MKETHYTADTAETLLINAVIHLSGVKKNHIGYKMACEFIESDAGGEIFDKHYEKFKYLPAGFAGPYKFERFAGFRKDFHSKFSAWRKYKKSVV